MTKRAWQVVTATGESRGTYASFKTAELIAALASVCEWTNASIKPVRLWFWQRGGLHVKPVRSR